MCTNADEHLPFHHLLPPNWQAKVQEWLDEDIPSFDYGGFVVGETENTATLFMKATGVVAGRPFFDEIFRRLDCQTEWFVEEGSYHKASDARRVKAAVVRGPARCILLGERTALNLFARCSGIATRARALVELKKDAGWHGAVAGTRKTTPGFRIVEKYAMLVGGADTHRMDLSSMVMLKDNHIWSQGSITHAVKKARRVCGFALKIEVEARNYEEAIEACAAGADVVMLDNFPPLGAKECAARVKEQYPHVMLEVSGGITEETLVQYISKDIDVVSLGSLSQGVSFIDFSLKINREL
eukprot:Clim_evm6s161 gene=Clim_evmTU6s161